MAWRPQFFPSPCWKRKEPSATQRPAADRQSATPTPRFCCWSRYNSSLAGVPRSPLRDRRPGPALARYGGEERRRAPRQSTGSSPPARSSATASANGGRVQEGGGEERADRAGAPQAAAQPQMRQLQRTRKRSPLPRHFRVARGLFAASDRRCSMFYSCTSLCFLGVCGDVTL